MSHGLVRPVLGILGLALLGLQGLLPAGPPADTRPVATATAFVVLSGDDSAVTEEQLLRVTDDEAWTDLWRRHRGLPTDKPYNRYYDAATCPLVDFESCMVIALLRGDTTNCAGLRLVEVDDDGRRLRLRVKAKSYQTMAASIDPEDMQGDAVRPYAFVVLPRSDLPVQVEFDRSGLGQREPRWVREGELAGR